MAPALLSGGVMIDPIFQTDNYQLARKLLDASVLRQQAIATNIANAETPGFHRIDLTPDFATTLKAELASGDFATHADSVQPKLAVDESARSMRPDGNTVELEHELTGMDQNAVQFDYLSQIITFDLKQLKMAITGVVS